MANNYYFIHKQLEMVSCKRHYTQLFDSYYLAMGSLRHWKNHLQSPYFIHTIL